MDSQVVELLGRNRLIDELLRAGLEVALPERDRGIDLIAYADLESNVSSFTACPIQLKASSATSFSIDRKYEKFPDLILAFVWNLDVDEESVTHSLFYDEAIDIADSIGWTKTRSWIDENRYSTPKPSRELMDLLEPHRMTPERWWRKVVELRRTSPDT